jgi:hypothetical protein
MSHSCLNSLRKKHPPEYKFQSNLCHKTEISRLPLTEIQNAGMIGNEEPKRFPLYGLSESKSTVE